MTEKGLHMDVYRDGEQVRTRLSPRVIVENTEADKDNISSHLSSVVLDSDGEYAERCDCAAAAPYAHMDEHEQLRRGDR